MKKSIVMLAVLTMGTGSFLQAAYAEDLDPDDSPEMKQLYHDAHYFPWGGHLAACKRAVAALNNTYGGWDEQLNWNVVNACSNCTPEGPQWVEKSFQPWLIAYYNAMITMRRR